MKTGTGVAAVNFVVDQSPSVTSLPSAPIGPREGRGWECKRVKTNNEDGLNQIEAERRSSTGLHWSVRLLQNLVDRRGGSAGLRRRVAGEVTGGED